MYLLFDIGGTKTRLAISRDGENFMSFEIKDTPEDFESGITMFGEYVKSQGIGIQKVVGGIAGVLNSEKTTLTFSPNLAGWIGKNLKSSLSRIVGTKEVYLENDAALDGLGEAVFGSGKGARIVAFITVSTGVGGARIVNKRIDVSNYGFEPGHQILEVGQKGLIDLEGLIGGASIQKKYNISPMDLKDDNIWQEIYHHLAIGLTNVSVFWSPDIIVLGGGVVASDYFSIDSLTAKFKEVFNVFPEIPIIKKSTLGDHAGLYGALHLLKQN